MPKLKVMNRKNWLFLKLSDINGLLPAKPKRANCRAVYD
jgi:hypothetical protein